MALDGSASDGIVPLVIIGGTLVRLTEEQKEFAWKNMGAGIFHAKRAKARRERLRFLDRQTMDQEVAVAVCKATANYKESKGAFSTYVEAYVRQGLQRALKRHPVVSPPWWFTDFYYQDRAEEEIEYARQCFRRYEAVLPSDRVADGVFDEVYANEFRELVLRVLTPRPREIIRRRYFEDQGFERIAADMKISWQRVQQLHDQAIKRLSLLKFD
jgi:RNA polymerase sigma factor (sigma-70 family)